MGPESQKSVLRVSWHLNWVDEPWGWVSSALKEVAEGKLDECYDYFWKTHLPRSVSEYVRSPVDEELAIISDDSINQARVRIKSIVDKRDKEIRALKSDLRN